MNRRVILLVVICLTSFTVWAAFFEINELVRADGSVAPAQQNQLVQNLEGGIVQSIFVTEGDLVKVGQVVAQMDRREFHNAYQELKEREFSLQVRLERLQAEKLKKEAFIFSALSTEQNHDVVLSEAALFDARMTKYLATVSAFQSTLDLRQAEVELLEPLVEKGAVPEIEIIQKRLELVRAAGDLGTYKGDFESERSEEYAAALIELRQIRQQIDTRRDQLDRTEIASPVNGIVNQVAITTLGGIVDPGEPILEITPLGENLRVSAQVRPQDIGFVRTGIPATIKLTAYDFAIYGTIRGKVINVSADTIDEDTPQGRQPFYIVTVELESQSLKGPKNTVAIRPGMQTVVELETGNRTVLTYLLKPLFRATEAFSER